MHDFATGSSHESNGNPPSDFAGHLGWPGPVCAFISPVDFGEAERVSRQMVMRKRVWLALLLGALAHGADLRAAGRLEVKAFEFSGNTVYSSAELTGLLTNYTGRSLNATQLDEARRVITMHYVDAGYVNSGCLLEAQKVKDGVVKLRVVEGTLSELHVTGNRWLRAGYIRPRIWQAAGKPLNLKRLQEGMLVMRQKPFVRNVKAELQPGEKRGEGILDVRVEEARMAQLSFSANNYRPPSVGAEQLDGTLTVNNPTGWGDQFSFTIGILQHENESVRAPGFRNVGLRYEAPLNPEDTTLRLRFDRRNYAVVEEPFDALNIETIAEYYAIDLRHPLRKSLTEELSVFLSAELRESRTLLAGTPFNLAPGAVDGRSRVAVWRLGMEYLKRSEQQVFVGRLTANYGTGALNATDDGTARDARFASVAGQAQYLRVLNDAGHQLVLSGGFQWSESPLISLEQFSLGGAATVRGYRENAVVRDAGMRGTVEIRLPVTSPVLGDRLKPASLQFVPFFDLGAAWNVSGSTPNPVWLPSAGAGLIWNPHERLNTRLFWGHAFESVADTSGDLQDHGIHFSVNYRAF